MGARYWLCAALLVACKVDQDMGAAGDRTGTKFSVSPLPKLGKTGGVSYEIIDDATGKRMPGKLTFIGVKGTKDPRFSKGDIGKEDDDSTAVSAFNRVFTLDGVGV